MYIPMTKKVPKVFKKHRLRSHSREKVNVSQSSGIVKKIIVLALYSNLIINREALENSPLVGTSRVAHQDFHSYSKYSQSPPYE